MYAWPDGNVWIEVYLGCQWRMKVGWLGSPTRNIDHPGGDWHPGQGDNPKSTNIQFNIHNTHTHIILLMAEIRLTS